MIDRRPAEARPMTRRTQHRILAISALLFLATFTWWQYTSYVRDFTLIP